jgi:hypothetical protein
MRFFPPGFRTGELDVDARQQQAAYLQYLGFLRPPLPPDALDLSRTVNLHDGLLRHYHFDKRGGTVDLRFRAGDLQVGYFDLNVHYLEAAVDPASDVLLRNAVGDRHSELLDDEFDAADATVWVHRFLFRPDRETTIRFGGLTWAHEPRRDRFSADAA